MFVMMMTLPVVVCVLLCVVGGKLSDKSTV